VHGWEGYPANWLPVRQHCRKFTAIFSDDDPYVPLDNADLFRRELGAEVQILTGHGHFSGPSDNCRKYQKRATRSSASHKKIKPAILMTV